MAITVGTFASGEADGVTTTSFSVDCGTDANRLLIVGVNISNAGSVTSITYNSVAMTAITSKSDGGGPNNKAILYQLVNPSSGSNTLAYTQNDTWSHSLVTALPFAGVDQTTPLGTAATASGGASPSAPSVDVSSATGELVVDFVAQVGTNETGTLTAGTGQTDRGQKKGGFKTAVMSTEAGATTVTMSWSQTLMVAWAQIGVSIKPAADATATWPGYYGSSKGWF